jgi:hypothetical protein
MDMIGKLFGLGNAARQVGGAIGDVAEIFVGNRAAREAADHERGMRALAQFGEEFAHPATRPFDSFVNGLNRLPRPMMALGTLGLFVYAMMEPAGFAVRMQGLDHIPEPLWWLLGAIVSFYFGARELHHYRCRKLDLPQPRPETPPAPARAAIPADVRIGQEPAATGAPETKVRAPAAQQAPAVSLSAPAPPARPAVESRAADPNWNAAFEEWRAQQN